MYLMEPFFCLLSTVVVSCGYVIVDNVLTTLLSFHTVATRFPVCRNKNSLCCNLGDFSLSYLV